MLTAEGCRQRRQRLWERLDATSPDFREVNQLVLADPVHLMYLANFHVDPFSLGAGFGGYLVLDRGGNARLFHDNLLPESVEQAHVDDRQAVRWYDAVTPARGTRRLALQDAVSTHPRIHDCLVDPLAQAIVETLALMRRQKDADEIALLERCMCAAEAGHAWALSNVRSGMTELDVYCGVSAACIQAAGQSVIVYGDFAVSPGPERRGGPPTDRVLKSGDMLIVDFSVVIGGYRSDTTNTLVVDGHPTTAQQRLYQLCTKAMATGEERLTPGTVSSAVHEAVNGAFERAGMATSFAHHAGHGLGLTHPEAPYFVRGANDLLLPSDVVTLEPGLYVSGIGGIRIEHNYLITANGHRRLSNHRIALTAEMKT
jgi:Xaa-Pro aminopeptidase